MKMARLGDLWIVICMIQLQLPVSCHSLVQLVWPIKLCGEALLNFLGFNAVVQLESQRVVLASFMGSADSLYLPRNFSS